MSRIPYRDPKTYSEDVAKLMGKAPQMNLFRMLAGTEGLLPAFTRLGNHLLYRSELDPVLRELAILRVGHLCGSGYEVHQHRKIAQAIGIAADRIDGTAREADPALYDARELLVLRMAEQLVRKVKADDALFAATAAALGHEQTMELVIIIGTYVMLAQVLENAGVEPEAGTGPAQGDVEKLFGHQAAAR